MSERRCETCRYWVDDEWSERARTRFEYDAGAVGQLEGYRRCGARMWSTGQTQENQWNATAVSLAMLDNIYGEDGTALVTAPDFFCALHEEKA